ncbi:capsular biosynthesis protein CpsI, partial [Mesorhizobium sp. 98Argb]
KLFNNGNHTRDFTYIDDIAEGVIRASDSPAAANPAWDSSHPDPATSSAPWRIFNIGNNNPVKLTAYVEALENALGRKAVIDLLPLQAGDVPDTFADTSVLERSVGYRPATSVTDGVGRFVDWYQAHFGTSRLL